MISNKGKLYVSIASSNDKTKILESSDNGVSWSEVGTLNVEVVDMLFKGNTLFAATKNGVYTSVDQGQNWTQLGGGLSATSYETIALDGTTLYAGSHDQGVYRSTDNGSTWASLSGSNGSYANKVYSNQQGELFVANRSGVYRADNASMVWQPKNDGFPAYLVLDVLRADGTVFVATDHGGVRASTDNGNAWADITFNLVKYGRANSLAYCLDTLYVGTEYGLYYQTSTQGEWTEVGDFDNVTDLIVTKDEAYIIESNLVHRRIKGSDTWQQASIGLPKRITSIDRSGSNLIVKGDEHLYLSKDQGGIWTRIESDVFTRETISKLAITQDYVYAIQTGDGSDDLLRSSDDGVTWLKVSELDNASAVAANESFIIVGNGSGQVFVSNHSDFQWREISNGYPTKGTLWGLSLSGEQLTASFSGGQGFWLRDLKEPLVFPEAPTALSALVLDRGVVDLTWKDQSDDETGFVIFRAKQVPYNFIPVDTVASNVTTYRDTTDYWYPQLTFYRVVATIDGNTSAVHTTLPIVALHPECFTTHHTDSSFVLWQYHRNVADTLAVDISTDRSFKTFLPDFERRLVKADSSFVKGISSQDTYYVRYRPYYAGYYGSYFETLVVELAPTAPTGFMVQNAGPQRLYFTWTDNSDNETAFLIEYKEAGYADVEYDSLIQVATNETSVMLNDALTSARSHYAFRVAAVNKGGRSYSEEGDIVTAIDKQRGESAALGIFPNPAHHQVTAPGVSIAPVRIKDVAGRLLTVPQRVSPKGTQLDVSALPPGIYFAEITADEKTVVKRFIRK